MINQIKSRYSKHKALINNFNYMSLLQLFQLILPLITYPYLIRVLGNDLYGVVAFSNAIIVYISVFIDFGFNISEVREISISRDDTIAVSKIVSSVITIKTAFAVVSFLFLIVLISFVPKLNEHKLLYYASMGMLLDTAINPRFFFQGIEKMKFITLLNLGARVFFLVMIFLVVRKPNDYFLVPLMTSVGAVVSSIIGLFLIYNIYGLRYVKPSISILRETIKNSIPFFSSRLSVLAINKTNVILIGAFIGYQQVAYYDLADKLVSVMKMPFNIFNQVLFPSVSRTKNISIVVKTLKYLIVIYFLGYVSLFVFGESLIVLIGGDSMLPTKSILYIMGFSAITELISVFLGAPLLLAMGYVGKYNGSIIWGSVFYMGMMSLLFLINFVTLHSLAGLVVLGSAFIMIYRLHFCKKYNLI